MVVMHWTKKKTVLRKLNPFLDKDGIIRVGGQILKADLSEVLKTPVILPKSSNVASLLIRHTHGRTHHSGRGITLNKICAIGYWIISRSTMVRWFIFQMKKSQKMSHISLSLRYHGRTKDG